MRSSARPMREELDDLEDKSWKRKSYALAQHNALPIPMPHPVYPPPKPIPPPAVVLRPSRLRSRPPGAGYRHPASYHPVLRQNNYQKPPPLDRLPTLSETNAATPNPPLRRAPSPPRERPTIQASPLEHGGISASPPELTTFRAPPARPVISPASPSRSNNIHGLPLKPPDTSDSLTRPSSIPVPMKRSNYIPASSSQPTHILPPQSHIDTFVSPSKPVILQDSVTPRYGAGHPVLTTFAPPPPPEPTPPPPPPPPTTFLPQERHSSPEPPPEPTTTPPPAYTFLPQQTHRSPQPPPEPTTPPPPTPPPTTTFLPQETRSSPEPPPQPTTTPPPAYSFLPQPPPEPTTPPPPPTTTFLPQQTYNSPPQPPPAPKTPPTLPSKTPPQVQPRGSKIDHVVPSSPPPPPAAQKIPHNKKVSVPPRPKVAPPAIPSSTSKRSEFTPESQESLPSTSESLLTQPKPLQTHPEPLDKPVIPSQPASHSPLAEVDHTSALVSPTLQSDAERDASRVCTSPGTSLGADSENPQTTKNASDLNSFAVDSLRQDSNPTSQISKVSETPTAESNLTTPPSVGITALQEESKSTPQISKVVESLTTEPTTTSPMPDDKTDPQSVTPAPQHLPLTPSSQSRSSSLASIGCPRTPTSIRAAPSFQPIFPATPLTRRSTSASTSENSLSPCSYNATPRPTTSPEGCQNFLPTPPSSPSQTRVDSVTPSSSISSFPHGHGQSVTGEEEELEQQAAPAEDNPDPPCSSPPDATLHNSDKADKVIMPVANNTSHTEELGCGPSKSLPTTETFQTYKTRFWILTVFSFICFLQTIVWGTFGPIAESAQAAFPSWDDSTIAAFPNWGPIVVVVFIYPMMWLSQKLGLQIAMIVCELFLTVGTMLRCFTSEETVFTVMCHVSSVLFAFAACFTLSLPAMLAATWFPPSERITATAVGTLMCQLGAAAMYLGALVVRYPSSFVTAQEKEDIRGDIMVLMYIHFGAALLLLLAVVIYFPAKPPTPPSASSTEERIDYFKAIRMMFKKLQMVLVLLVFAFSFGVPVVWIAVLNLSLKDIGINQDKAMGIAVTAVVCSSVTAFIAARITDKMYGHLKVTVIVLLGISSVFFLWFLLLTTQVIYPTLGQVYVAVAGGLGFEYATVPLLVELAVEIGFPIPESVTGATLTFVFNLVSLVFLGLFQIPNDNHLWVSCVLLACVSLSIIPLLFVKETHKRSDTDRKFM